MMTVLFISGIFTGTILGVLIMAIIQINRGEDENANKK